MIHEVLLMAVLVAGGHARVYVRSVGGLLAMLPALPRDRRLMRSIRVVSDRDLLECGPLVMRGDIARNRIVRSGRLIYERLLDLHWRLLRRTLLAR
jgi:hypothetical protein